MKSVTVLGDADAPGATVAGDELGAVVEPGVTAGLDPGLLEGAVVVVDGAVVVDELGRVVDGVVGAVVDVDGVVCVVEGLVVEGLVVEGLVVEGLVVAALGSVEEADGVVVEVVARAAPASAPNSTIDAPIIRARTTVTIRRAANWTGPTPTANLPLRRR